MINKKKKQIKWIPKIVILMIIILGILSLKLNTSKKIIIYQTQQEDIILQIGKKIIKTKIKDATNIHPLNSKYIFYQKGNYLYIYNVSNNSQRSITKKYMQLLEYNESYIAYKTEKNTYIYDIKKNQNQKIKNVDSIEFSPNNNKMILHRDNNLIIYDASKSKEEIVVENVYQYKCINDSCKNFFYIQDNNLKKYQNKEIDLQEKAMDILWQKKEEVIYQNYQKNEYILYYKRKNKKAVKLDTNKRIHENVKVYNNQIVYLSGGNVKEISKNGQNGKIIERNVDKIIDKYGNKYLLIKNQNNLYWNNTNLDDKVEVESINIIDNKIYYLTKNNDIYHLVERTKKNKKIMNKNVKEISTYKNQLYYLGDFNLYHQYGTIYQIHSNKKIKNVKELLKIEEF